MDPSQFFYFTSDGSQLPNFTAENFVDSSSSPSAWPSSSSAANRRRQPRPSQQPETSQRPKRQRTEAAGWQPQSFRTGAPGWQPQQPSYQNYRPFTAQDNTNAETEQRPFLYQFQAKLTKLYLTERQYQAAVSRMRDFTDKPTLVQIMESMAEKMVHVDPRETLNLFPTEPSSFRPAAEDRGESRQ